KRLLTTLVHTRALGKFPRKRRTIMRLTKSLALRLSIATIVAILSSPPSRALGINGSADVATGVRPSGSALAKTYSKLPMSFEKNAGQSDPGVEFIARGAGYSVFLSAGETVLVVKKQRLPERTSDAVAKEAKAAATIRMKLVGSKPVLPAGEDQLPGKVNY